MAKNNLYVFRRYKKKEGNSKKKHPKLIVDDVGSNYGYMGLTENKTRGKRHYNIPITNPRLGDNRPAYLRKQIDYDTKSNFSDVLKNYNLSKKDRKFVEDFVNKRIK